MTTFKNDLWHYLTNNTAISALIGNHLYPTQAPQNLEAPFVVYTLIHYEELMAHSGPTGDRMAEIQFNVVAATVVSAESVSDAFTTALVGLRQSIGASNTTFVARCAIEHNQDLGFDEDTQRFEKSLGFSFRYNH